MEDILKYKLNNFKANLTEGVIIFYIYYDVRLWYTMMSHYSSSNFVILWGEKYTWKY